MVVISSFFPFADKPKERSNGLPIIAFCLVAFIFLVVSVFPSVARAPGPLNVSSGVKVNGSVDAIPVRSVSFRGASEALVRVDGSDFASFKLLNRVERDSSGRLVLQDCDILSCRVYLNVSSLAGFRLSGSNRLEGLVRGSGEGRAWFSGLFVKEKRSVLVEKPSFVVLEEEFNGSVRRNRVRNGSVMVSEEVVDWWPVSGDSVSLEPGSSREFALEFRRDSPFGVFDLIPVFGGLGFGEWAWWDEGWPYFQYVGVESGVSSDLTGFPAKVVVDTTDSSRFNQSNCKNVRFTSSDGSVVLPFEVDSGCGTGETIFWVGVNLSGGSGVFKLWSGNLNASDGSDAEGLCSVANLASMYHFQNNSTLVDSCNRNDLSFYGSGSCDLVSSTPLGKGISFSGYCGYSRLYPSGLPSGGQDSTETVVAFKHELGRSLGILWRYGSEGWYKLRDFLDCNDSGPCAGVNATYGIGADYLIPTSRMVVGEWASYANRQTAPSSRQIFRNAVLDKSGGSAQANTGQNSLSVGYYGEGYSQWFFYGWITELRIYTEAKSDDWILAEKIQDSSVGGVQSQPPINFSDWDHVFPIEINTWVSSGLIGFPALVKVDSTDSELWNTSTCGNVRFTDDNETLLRYDVASGCNSSSTEIYVGVNTSASGQTTIWMYLGNVGVADGRNAASLCAGANLVSMYHLQANSSLVDSCGVNNLARVGYCPLIPETPAGGGINFTGSCGFAKGSPSLLPSGSANSTETVVAFKQSLEKSLGILWRYGSEGYYSLRDLLDCNDSGPCSSINLTYGIGGDYLIPTSRMAVGGWVSYATRQIAPASRQLFKDGGLDKNGGNYNANTGQNSLSVGYYGEGYNQWYFVGAITELRIYSEAKSNDWIIAESEQTSSVGAEIVMEVITNATAIKADGSPYQNNTWTNSSYVNITLSCFDGYGYGCDITQYCLNSSNSSNCTPSIIYNGTVQIATEGNNSFCYRSNNTVGNVGETKCMKILIDNTPPASNASGIASSGEEYLFGTWTDDYVNISLTCSDNGSGCGATYYCIDQNDSCNPDSLYYDTLQEDTSGISYLRYYSTDTFGNVESVKSSQIQILTPSEMVQSVAPDSPQPRFTAINFTCNYEDEYQNFIPNATAYVAINGVNFNTSVGTFYEFSTDSLSAGDHTWMCVANKSGYDDANGTLETYTIQAITHNYDFDVPYEIDVPINSTPTASNAASNQSLFGYYSTATTNADATYAFENYKHDSIFFFNGHGYGNETVNGGALSFIYYDPGMSMYTYSYISGLFPDQENPNKSTKGFRPISNYSTNELSGVLLAVYDGCYTGNDHPLLGNLLNKSLEKGVRCAIGFDDTLFDTKADAWANSFWYYLSLNETVNNAAYDAQYNATQNALPTGDSGGLNSMNLRGDCDFSISPQRYNGDD